MAEQTIGKITQVIGAVLDIKFAEGSLPEINEAIRIERGENEKLIVEVAQHLGDDTVRCIAMGPTDGLVRGMDAIATGAPITVPVGEKTLGRIFNVLGEAIDNKEQPTDVDYEPIHRPAPQFAEQSTETELLETGIKVVDLLCPYQKGGKIGLFGGAGVGKTVLIKELINNVYKMQSLFPAEKAAKLSAKNLELIEEIADRTAFIKEHVDAMIEARKVANKIESEREKAIAYHDNIVPMMEEIRYHIDKLELIVDNQMWTLPKYRELLFIR